MSFISDNPVYIQGDLNLHMDSTGTLIEEFNELLMDDWSNFYSRTNLNTDFARLDTDSWRPTTVLADAITILSNNFCDGFTEDGMSPNTPECNDAAGTAVADSRSSYVNSFLFNTPHTLEREDYNNPPGSSPVRIDRNGNLYENNNTIFFGSPIENNSTNYRDINDRDTDRRQFANSDLLGQAIETRINAVVISGLTPSRANQSYGGLHNFPRFLEKWRQITNLHIQGAFLQLNFSTYATAPYDQESLIFSGNSAPSALPVTPVTPVTPATSFLYGHYLAPRRQWGYDVALQYQPPEQIAERFVSVSNPRHEFYTEEPVDDPYNQLLFCAREQGSTNQLYPALCQ